MAARRLPCPRPPKRVGTAHTPGPSRTAAYVTEPGPTDRIRVGELPLPPLGPTDVLVAVEALAVNHVDTFVRSGRWRTPTPFPFVVGRDLVGRVVDAGEGTTGFAPGDRVWCNSMGYAGRQGAFATEVVVPAERLFRVPDGTDPVDAVAALHPAATAARGLFHHAWLRPGGGVVIGGAGGGVGSAALQMAAAAGPRAGSSSCPDGPAGP